MNHGKEAPSRQPGSKSVVLGIDFGATNLKALLVDEGGRAQKNYLMKSLTQQGPDACLERISDLVRLARKDAAEADLALGGIGLGICGPVDHEAGALVESPLLPGWHDIAVSRILEEDTGSRVHLENFSARQN